MMMMDMGQGRRLQGWWWWSVKRTRAICPPGLRSYDVIYHQPGRRRRVEWNIIVYPALACLLCDGVPRLCGVLGEII